MLISGLEVLYQDGKCILVVQSEFMRHEFITLVPMLVDFECISRVFKVDFLKRWFKYADLF